MRSRCCLCVCVCVSPLSLLGNGSVETLPRLRTNTRKLFGHGNSEIRTGTNERTNESEENIGTPIIASYRTLLSLFLLVRLRYWSSLTLHPHQFFPLVIYSCILMMEAICSTETLVLLYQTTRCRIPEESDLQSKCIKFQIYFIYMLFCYFLSA
jgi:hypothetical protein